MPAVAPEETPAVPSPGSVEEVKPDMALVPDEEGNLRRVFNVPYEKFVKWMKGEEAQPPQYTLQSIQVTGKADSGRAELQVEIAVGLREDAWVRIPLRLDGAVLRPDVKYDGSGKYDLQFDQEGDGHALWLYGSQDEPHRLTLQVLVPLKQVGSETRLKLPLPRATTSSLKLDIPLPEAEAEVTGGRAALVSATSDGGKTVLELLGPDSEFELRWRKLGTNSTDVEPVLEATGTVRAVVQQRQIVTEATLSVRGRAGKFDRFHVRLPEASELAECNLNHSEPSEGLVEVFFSPVDSKDSADPVVVQLTTRRQLEDVPSADWFELAGFEVPEATIQKGHVGVYVRDDRDVLCSPGQRVRPVREVPEDFQAEGLTACFEYSGQPFSLAARVSQRQPRVDVEPVYLLDVGPQRVDLTAKLKYAVRGGEVFSVDLLMSGWTVDRVGPENLVAAQVADPSSSDLLSIRLAKASPADFELEIAAHRDVAAEAPAVNLPLPRPTANQATRAALSTRQAWVVVVSSDNLELTPDLDSSAGLARRQDDPPVELPQRQHSPLVYRTEADDAVFAAARTIHPRRVTVDVQTEVQLTGGQSRVGQRLAYRIDYEPVERLLLAVPGQLADAANLEVLLNGEATRWSSVPDITPSGSKPADAEAAPSDSAAEPDSVLRQVQLPEPMIGSCELAIRYPIDVDELRPRASVVAAVPLVMPLDGGLGSNEVHVTANPGVSVKPLEGLWTADERELSPPEAAALNLVSPDRSAEVALALVLEDPDALGSTTVDRQWVQTWVTQGVRRDRAVFQVTSDQPTVELILPDGVDVEKAQFVMDGQSIFPENVLDRSVILAVPNHSEDRTHTLEARYPLSTEHGRRGRLSVELPRLGRRTWVRRFYWQLILPRNEHVVLGPEPLIPEYRLRWNGAFWARVPTLEQPELESWMGASAWDPVPEATSRYLFSSLGPVERCELRTAGRSTIVLAFSGIVLVVGLILIYVPAGRHPATLLLAAVVVAAMLAVWPAAALLAGQAAVLGVGLTLMAGLLHRSLSRRRRGRPAETSSSIFDRGSTRTLRHAPAAGSRGSTQTAPAAVPASSEDSAS